MACFASSDFVPKPVKCRDNYSKSALALSKSPDLKDSKKLEP
jgi:hypothetical protein